MGHQLYVLLVNTTVDYSLLPNPLKLVWWGGDRLTLLKSLQIPPR